MLEFAVIVLAVFSVPLTGIASYTYLKAKKISAEANGKRLLEKIEDLEEDNRDLKRRMEVLETIAIDSRRDGFVGARQLEELAEQADVAVRRR